MKIVVCARMKKLNKQKATRAFKHNLREREDMEIHRSKSHVDQNRLINNRIFTFSENDWLSLDPIEYSELEKIKQLKKSIEDRVKTHYESQKDSKGRKKSLRKNTQIFGETILVFGTDRQKKPNEALLSEESDYINSMNFDESAKRYCLELKKQYGWNDFVMVKHMDEKTCHYQIIYSNYDYTKGTFFSIKGGDRREKYAEFGSNLQDIAHRAFVVDFPEILRGERGSTRKHYIPEVVPEIEKEFKRYVEKEENEKKIEEGISNAFEKAKIILKVEEKGLFTNKTKEVSKISDKKLKENLKEEIKKLQNLKDQEVEDTIFYMKQAIYGDQYLTLEKTDKEVLRDLKQKLDQFDVSNIEKLQKDNEKLKTEKEEYELRANKIKQDFENYSTKFNLNSLSSAINKVKQIASTFYEIKLKLHDYFIERKSYTVKSDTYIEANKRINEVDQYIRDNENKMEKLRLDELNENKIKLSENILIAKKEQLSPKALQHSQPSMV